MDRVTKQFFDDILVMVNFNFPHYEVLPLFLDINGQFFNDIIVVGSTPFSPRGPTSRVKFFLYNTSEGERAHEAFHQVVLAHPGYAGYLWLNDDVLVNVYRLAQLSKSSMWLAREVAHGDGFPYGYDWPYMHVLDDHTDVWNWWNRADGKNACSALYAYQEDIDHVYIRAIERLTRSHACFHMWSDLFYLPADARVRFLDLAPFFDRSKMHMEAAFTTMARMLFEGYFVGINYLDMIYLWEGLRELDIARLLITPSVDAAHPLKLSLPAVFEWWSDWMRRARSAALDSFTKRTNKGHAN